MKKPKWVVEKEQSKRAQAAQTLWLFGLHAVRDALINPRRDKLRLVVTKNALDRLGADLGGPELGGIEPEIADPRKFPVPLDPGSVHQGCALEVRPLNWGPLDEVCAPVGAARVVLLDQVSDPHNVGAILRSAEVFGARAVVGTQRHAAPETGALAKTASGALERQPYLRERNLAETIQRLQTLGYTVLALDGEAEVTLDHAMAPIRDLPVALVMGAEGPGLRARTKEVADQVVKIPFAGAFGSLNVSNAAAVALYEARAYG